eukprot:m51a1_g6330 hypothetical protein (1215) ;mRNA; r:7319-11931
MTAPHHPQDFRALLKQTYVPRVLVVCDEALDAACRRATGLCLADHLQSLYATQVAARAAPTETRIRFVGEASLRQIPDAELPGLLHKAAVSVARDSYDSFSLRCTEDVALFKRAFANPTPWFDEWRACYIESIGATPFSTLEHPVACVIAVHPEGARSAVAEAVNLWGPNSAPKCLRDLPFIDSAIPRFYAHVVLDGDCSPASSGLADLLGSFGAKSCAELRLGGPAAEYERFCRALTYECVLPHLHATINTLAAQAQQAKKSLGSRVKSLFRLSAAPAPTSGPSSASGYGFIRKLADFQFLIGDYENATKHYQQVGSEYRNDKAMQHYAATQEMVGLCYHLSDGYKSPEYYLEQAVSTLETVSCASDAERALNRRLVAKASLHLAAVLLQRSWASRACDVLAAVSRGQSDEFSATVVEEQAAFTQLQLAPPRARRFCYSLVLAGERYGNMGESGHASRCLALASTMYAGRGWAYIDDYANDALVKHSVTRGLMRDAQTYVSRLVQNNKHMFYVQNSILRQLIFIFKKRILEDLETAKIALPPGMPPPLPLLPELPLPVIVGETICVRLSDDPPECASQRCSMSGVSWPQSRDRVAVTGEPIRVSFEVVNPLSVPVPLSQVHLVANHDSGLKSALSPMPVDLVLCPNDRREVVLELVPRAEGLVRLEGVAFNLCREVWGTRRLSVPLARCRAQAADPLAVRVVPAMPCVRASLSDDCAASLFEGEILAVMLTLRNDSELSAHNIQLSTSHPLFFSVEIPGQQQQQQGADGGLVKEIEMPMPLRATAGSPGSAGRVMSSPQPSQETTSRGSAPLQWFVLPDVLKPGAEVTLRCWFRAFGSTCAGDHTLHLAVKYEGSGAARSDVVGRRRVTHVHARMHVEPAVRVSHAVHADATDASCALLRVRVDNLQRKDNLRLRQFSLLSRSWALTQLYPLTDTSVLLAPRESSNFFFRLRPRDEPRARVRQSTVSLRDALFDATGEPHATLARQEMDSASDPGVSFEPPDVPCSPSQGMRSCSAYPTYSNSFSAEAETRAGAARSLLRDPEYIAVFWEAKGGSVGQSNVALTPQNQTSSWELSPAPVRVVASYEPAVQHDFSQGLCVVPLTLRLVNCHATRSICIVVDALSPEDPTRDWAASQSAPQAAMGTGYVWVGTTSVTEREIEPGEARAVGLRVCFWQAGVYNANAVRLTVTDESGRVVHATALTAMQNIVTVHGC